MSLCPLCSSQSELFYNDEFFLCPTCGGIFKNQELLLDAKDEKERYELHSDDVNDLGYQKFVSPITTNVFNDFKKENCGLDFGSGNSKIVATVLENESYNVKVYDPFFAPILENLKEKYDYITSCEVIEHFNNPQKEFALLQSLLKEGGKLYCMTHLYDESIDFSKWYYKNDPTHIFIYQAKTVEFIKNHFGFSDATIEKRLIVWSV